MTREEFYKNLKALDERFNSLKPELEVVVRDPALDLEGYVVVWSTLAAVDGPLGRCGKGGTRITPDVSLNEVGMLARTMALKNAAAGLPLGGAKSGLRGDPDSPGFEKKYRRFISLTKSFLRENGGIFGGFGFDIGGRPQHPHWACDELKSTRSFTGKPVEMGGTDYDKEGIAGLGVSVAGRTLLNELGVNIAGTSAAIQGLGAMGGAVFRYFSEFGADIRYISDPRLEGTFALTPALAKKLHPFVSVQDFGGIKRLLDEHNAERFPLEAILYQKVDLLFPCALQGVVTLDNVSRIQAGYVVEGANNPISDEARTALWNRNILVIPDFIANPGGVIAAFVEMTSSITPEENKRTRQNVSDAKTAAETCIQENVRRVLAFVKEIKVEPVHAGRYLALKNIFKN